MQSPQIRKQHCRIGLVLVLVLATLLPNHPARADTNGWTHLLGGNGLDYAAGVVIDTNDNIIITGTTGEPLDGQLAQGFLDVFISKFDSNGTKLWTRLLGGPYWEEASGIATDASGNLYVTGFTYEQLDGQPNAGSADAFIAKYDPSGNRLWTRQFGTAEFDNTTGIAVDSNGNVYLSGYTYGSLYGPPNVRNSDVFIAKYDTDGNRQWFNIFGTPGDDGGGGIAVDAAGNVYLTGGVEGPVDGQPYAGKGDAFIAKYDPSGARLWIRLFGSPEGDGASGVAIDSDGNLLLTGATSGDLAGQVNAGGYCLQKRQCYDVFVSKFTAGGTQVWTRMFGSAEDEYVKSIDIDSRNNIYIAGSTFGPLDGQPHYRSSNAFAVKLDSTGTQQWTYLLDPYGYSEARSIAVDSKSNVYLAGSVSFALDGQPYGGNADAFITKLGMYARMNGVLLVSPCTQNSSPIARTVDPTHAFDTLETTINNAPDGMNVTLTQQQGIITATVSAGCQLAYGFYQLPVTVSNTAGEASTTEARILVYQSQDFHPLVGKLGNGGW